MGMGMGQIGSEGQWDSVSLGQASLDEDQGEGGDQDEDQGWDLQQRIDAVAQVQQLKQENAALFRACLYACRPGLHSRPSCTSRRALPRRCSRRPARLSSSGAPCRRGSGPAGDLPGLLWPGRPARL
jgi:hypothetical protein